MNKRHPIAFTIHESCEATGLGKSSIYEAIARKELRARKMGSRTLILADDLTAWIASLPEAQVTYTKP